jgi:cell division transport system permease protein
MIARHFRRAFEDIFANRFVNGVTVVTIALAVLIVGAAALFLANTADLLNAWQRGIRIMAYLDPGTAAWPPALQQAIENLDGVEEARFIPKDEALEHLKAQVPHQASLFENLDENPLPDAFEIRLTPTGGWERVEFIAAQVAALKDIDEVEYGRKWLDTIRGIIELFRTTGTAIIGLYFLAAVSLVANTTRLVIYSRREEVEIMRLVGAAEAFIKTPFYIEGLIQGLLGAAAGLGLLFGLFNAFLSRLEQSGWAGATAIRFLSLDQLAVMVLGSMLVGWLGCYVSLRRFLRS